MKPRNVVLWAGALLLLSLLAALLGSAPPSQAGSDSWTTETSVNPSTNNYLNGVAAPATNVAWAVGYYDSGGAQKTPLIERWNGSSWATVTPIPTPSGWVSARLNGTVAFSATDGWAVGAANAAFARSRPYAVRTTDGGATWAAPTALPVYNAGNDYTFSGVGGTGNSDVWGVGYYVSPGGTPVPDIQHWGGSSWSGPYSITGVSAGAVYGVAANGASDAWAVGYEPDGGGIHRVLVARWAGSSWAQDTSMAFSIPNSSTDESLQSVTFLPNDDVMAVGYYYSSLTSSYQTVAFYYDGSSWSIQYPPNGDTGGDQLFGVAVVGDEYVWAVGHEADAASCCTLTARWDGSSWSRVSSPNLADAGNFLKAVAVGPDLGCGSYDTWAVGHYLVSGDPQTLIMRYTIPTGCGP